MSLWNLRTTSHHLASLGLLSIYSIKCLFCWLFRLLVENLKWMLGCWWCVASMARFFIPMMASGRQTFGRRGCCAREQGGKPIRLCCCTNENGSKFKQMRQFLTESQCHCDYMWLCHGKNKGTEIYAKTIGLMMMWITSRAEDKRHGTGSCVRCHKVQAVECRKEICSRTSFLQNEKPFGVVLFQQSFKFRYCNPFIAVNFNINGLFW